MAKLIETIAKLEKKIDELASRRIAVREPIEIHHAILDEVERQSQPAGRSRRVFPFNAIGVSVIAEDDGRRAALQAVLADEPLGRAIRERLAEAGVEFDASLEVAVRFVRKLRGGGASPAPFRLSFKSVEPPEAAGRSAVQKEALRARLVVLKGRAARKAFELTSEVTNIGRLAEVTDKSDRVVRRNQVVFLDSPDETTRTVSRAQAHITFSAPSEYRLHDDRSTYGTRIFRQGRTLEIPSGSPRGVRLRDGDEVYFGQAAVRFELAEPQPAASVHGGSSRAGKGRIEEKGKRR